jgi:hypothetical protein
MEGLSMRTRIQEELERQERSVHYLHRKIGGNRTLLYNICRGFGRATTPQRERIASALGLPIEALFDPDGMALKGN